MADIHDLLVALCRLWVTHPERVKIPERSQTLGSWALPMLSRSFAAEERERAAFELLHSVQALAAKHQKPTNQPTT